MPSMQDRDYCAGQGGNEGLEQHEAEADGDLDFVQAGGEAHEEVHKRLNQQVITALAVVEPLLLGETMLEGRFEDTKTVFRVFSAGVESFG
jgi:hypothetical protein